MLECLRLISSSTWTVLPPLTHCMSSIDMGLTLKSMAQMSGCSSSNFKGMTWRARLERVVDLGVAGAGEFGVVFLIEGLGVDERGGGLDFGFGD